MPIEFNCPSCGKAYRVKDELAGKSAKCKCGERVQVPSAPPAADPLFAEPLGVDLDAIEAPTAPTALSENERQAILSSPGTGSSSGSTWWMDLGKILGGGLVGVIVGLWAAGKAARRQQPGSLVLYMLGAGVFGLVAGTLLTIADRVRHAEREGRQVNFVLRLLFARGIISILVWVALAFPLTLIITMLTL